ncbi:uncharacterized protein METZ01_LOCUS133496 [marine metagenome]|uniref:Uncharacterized protein n=1 Tax=marine metagenome TaxID=408172 RepID=A0A381YVJ2_9ZZZZ
MMAITTDNSMSVNARPSFGRSMAAIS